MKEQPQEYRKPWYEYKGDVEKALTTLKQIFGNNPWHEHQKIFGYLEGYIEGMESAALGIEAEEYRKNYTTEEWEEIKE